MFVIQLNLNPSSHLESRQSEEQETQTMPDYVDSFNHDGRKKEGKIMKAWEIMHRREGYMNNV